MSRSRMLSLVCLLCALGSVPSAHAASVPFHGKAWKKGAKIRVHSALGARYDKAVNAAIANYAPSRTGARISFVRVSSKQRAQVVVRAMNEPLLPPGITDSQGYAGGRRITVRLNLKLAGFEKQTKGYKEGGATYLPDPYAATMLIAHELGHVVGLDHTGASTCSVANPGFFRACKNRGEADPYGYEGPRTYSCDFVQKIDAQALVRRYGGKAKAITGKRICRMDNGKPFERPKQPTASQIGATVTDAPGANPVISWKPQNDAEIFITRFDVRCSAVGEDTGGTDVQGTNPDGLIDMAAGSVEDRNPLLASDVSTPVDVCYRVTVVYGRSWGGYTVKTPIDAVFQP